MSRAAGVTVRGAAEFDRSTRKAAVDLGEMKAAAAETARIVASAGAARAPRRTGRLAGSMRPGALKGGTAIVRNPRPYAKPIHWGWPARRIAANPFLSDAATSTEPRWSAVYAAAVADAVDQIHGA